MLSVLLTPGGNKKVLHAFNSLHTLSNERHRWKLLVETITREPIDPPYQVCVGCMSGYTETHTHTRARANTHTTPLTSLQVAALIFINTIVQTASSLNAKVYLQHDFRLAGFDPQTVENVSSFKPCLSLPTLVCHPHLVSVTPNPCLSPPSHICHSTLCVTPTFVLCVSPPTHVCHPHLRPLCVTQPCVSPAALCLSPSQSLSGRQDERVLHELREWRDNFVDVNAIMDDLAAASGRANSLNQEVSGGSEMYPSA